MKASSDSAHVDTLAPPEVQSNRVRLRLMSPTDFEWLYQISLDPVQGWRWRFRGATPSREQFGRMIHEGVACQYVAERLEQCVPLGCVVLYDVHTQGHGKVAVLKDPACDDAGLMIEATALFVEYVFKVFPLRKLYAQAPDYTYVDFRSGAGRYFVEEGRFIEHEYYDGRWWDLVTLALSRQRWHDVSARVLSLLFSTYGPNGVTTNHMEDE